MEETVRGLTRQFNSMHAASTFSREKWAERDLARFRQGRLA